MYKAYRYGHNHFPNEDAVIVPVTISSENFKNITPVLALKRYLNKQRKYGMELYSWFIYHYSTMQQGPSANAPTYSMFIHFKHPARAMLFKLEFIETELSKFDLRY